MTIFAIVAKLIDSLAYIIVGINTLLINFSRHIRTLTAPLTFDFNFVQKIKPVYPTDGIYI